VPTGTIVWDPDYLATDTKQVLGLLHMYLSTEQQIPFDYRPFRICHNDGLSRTAFDLFESDTVARVWKYAKVRDEIYSYYCWLLGTWVFQVPYMEPRHATTA
jgi:hypothetical protein